MASEDPSAKEEGVPPTQDIFDAKVAPFNGVRAGRFAGKVAFITGATSGLGEHAAYHLAQEGCAIVVTGRREEHGAAVVKHIEGLQGISTLSPPALYIKVDVTDYDSVEAAATKIEETYGRLDAVRLYRPPLTRAVILRWCCCKILTDRYPPTRLCPPPQLSRFTVLPLL